MASWDKATGEMFLYFSQAEHFIGGFGKCEHAAQSSARYRREKRQIACIQIDAVLVRVVMTNRL